MFELEDAVTKAIQDNLPAAAAHTLQKYLSEAEKNKLLIVELNTRIDTMRLDQENTRATNSRLIAENEAWKKRLEGVEAREKAVLDSEHRLEIMTLREGCAKEMVTHTKELFGMVFRNTVVRENVLSNEKLQTFSPVYGPNGTSGYAPSGTDVRPVLSTHDRSAE